MGTQSVWSGLRRDTEVAEELRPRRGDLLPGVCPSPPFGERKLEGFLLLVEGFSLTEGLGGSGGGWGVLAERVSSFQGVTPWSSQRTEGPRAGVRLLVFQKDWQKGGSRRAAGPGYSPADTC